MTTGGTLQIANSTLTGNTSGGSGGAISTSSRSTTTITGSTLSGNTAQLSGGAIDNVGGLSLTNSTVSGNTATTMQGGGIYSDQNSSVSLLQSTITSNTASAQGGGIYLNASTLTSQNSIVVGNIASSYADIDAVNGTYTDGGGNVANTNSGVLVNAGMTGLGNFGGASQTIMPLPGNSPAICSGMLNSLGGLTVDQRGLPRTTTYNGTSCVDAGAVQTNYAIAFVTQPANATAGTDISPAPGVQISESGKPWNTATAQISISAAAGTLSGATVQSTSAGVATFSGLAVNQVESNDTLTAVLSLGSNWNLFATSAPFNVQSATPTLVFNSIPTQTYGNPPVQLSASSASSGAITYTVVSGPGSISGNGTTVTLTGAGTITVKAYQAANGNFATTSFVVSPATPVITWTPAAIAFGTPLGSAQLDAVATFSGNGSTVAGAYSYSPASGAQLGVGRQTLSVTFTPTDATDFTSATQSVTLAVNQANFTVNLASSLNPSTFGTSVIFTTTLPSGATGTVTFNDNGAPIATVPVSGATAILITSTLIAGSHSITAVYSGDSNFIGATSTTLTQVVNKATPVITWNNPAPIKYGTALSMTQLDATATFAGSPLSGGTFIYAPAGGTVLSSGTQRLSVTFTPSASDSINFTMATESVTSIVSQAAPFITWPAPAPITYGTALSSTQLDAAATDANGNIVAGSYTYAPPSTTVLDVGTQSLSVSFTPNDTTDFTANTGSTLITVLPATPVLAFTQISNQAFTATPITLSATSASPGAVTYAVVSGPATISHNQLTLTAAGTVSLSAAQAATSNYTSATATISFTTTETITLTIGPGSSSTATASSTGAATYGFNLSPSGGNTYPDEIVFSASGLPPGATATFTPATIQAGSMATPVSMTIQMPVQARNHNPLPIGPAAPVALGLMLLPLVGLKQVRRRLPLLLAVLVLSLGTALGLSGCAGGGSGSGNGSGSGSGNVSYTIVVTATDKTTGNQVSTNVVFVVP